MPSKLLVRVVLVVASLGLAFATSAQAAPAAASSESQRLRALLDEEWDWEMRQWPTWATAVGDPRYDDKLPDLSFAAIEQRKAHLRERLHRLEKIARARLGTEDQLNYDLYLRDARLGVEGARFPDELLTLNQMGGVHSELAEIAQYMPRRNAVDFDHFLARMDALPKLVEQHVALLRKGLERGITPPQVTLERLGELIGNQITDDPTKSPIYQIAFAQLPESISAAERARLQAAATKAIADKVMPSLRAFRTFVVGEYVPRARTSLGLAALPDGAEWYAYLARRSTTTDLLPERIHQIGLDEVARIHGQMEQAMRATGWKGSMEEFFTQLRTDPKFFFTDKTALVTAYRDIAKRIDPELPRLFGTLPRLTYGVRPVPAHDEKTQTTAYYSSGSGEVGRPGYFYANTYDLKSRPKWEMEALTLHEAVPGHHLQLAIAQELGALPRFRRFGGYTAFIEGWGLYAESLGGELGMLQDPYAKFGQLTYEMWRAVRLVVDTGIHSKGWTRQQSIDFFRKNAAKTPHDIEVEVDRYIVWPGQALAYKIGQLKIRELRTLAEERLGSRFVVRGFHDVVLGGGALPLDVLETRVLAWIDSRPKSAMKSP
ncbi:MAG: hypothetical protein JWN44_6244 [Myxococcales bacterium]|nr:hypothetical protein [Myxococcales bacterium]